MAGQIFDANEQPVHENAVIIAHSIYALLALHWCFGITYFIAVIVAYIKLDDVKDTWLESHLRWQIDTFWYSLIWAIIGILFCIIIIGIPIGVPILVINFLWLIYRIVKGWLRLLDKRTI